MKNRFLVRYWVKGSKKYLNSNKLIYNDGTYTQVSTKQSPSGTYYSYILYDWNTSELIPEQCTGLKDKNGKLIYEGDILAVPYIDPIFMQPVNMEVNNDVAYVEFYKGCFVAHYPEKQRKYLYDYENIAEVIGNIHENPDLLEQSDVAED